MALLRHTVRNKIPSNHRFNFRNVALCIFHEDLRNRPDLDTSANFRVELTKEGVVHPGAYPGHCQLDENEPAKRLAIRVDAKITDGRPFTQWIRHHSSTVNPNTVQLHNKAVTLLEGAELVEAERQRRKEEAKGRSGKSHGR